MKNWTIAARATVGIAVVLAMTIAVVVAGQFGLARVRQATSRVVGHMTALSVLGDVRAASLGVRRFEKDFIINAGDAAAQDKYAREWAVEVGKLRAALDRLQSSSGTVEERQAEQEAPAAVERYERGIEAMIADAQADRRLSPAQLNQRVAPVKDEIRRVIAVADRMSSARAEAIQREAVRVGATQRQTAFRLYLALVLGIASGIAVAWMVSRSISRAVGGLTREAGRLTGAVIEGALDVRAGERSVNPEFQAVVAGMNQTMDAFVKPIRVSARLLEQLASDQIPPPIDEPYRGDFDVIKRSLNRCIAAMALLDSDADRLAKAVAEGRLSTRIDAEKHQGAFRKITQTVNCALHAFTAPIDEANEVLGRLARRDLTARMMGTYRGDFRQMQASLNEAIGALHDAIGQVAVAAEQVASASSQIAGSSQALASGASEQASSFDATTASLESMSARIGQAADGAEQARALAEGARGNVREGTKDTAQMQTTMSKVRLSAEGTLAIIKDVSEIAFQTNLLALNAAVEAARAGEAGRGFAVVAEEVRSLASRAKEAAVKTEALIAESVKQAGEGEAVSAHVAGRLESIAADIARVADLVSELATSAKEQAGGIEQVHQSVGEMSKVTQQNASSSEESSSIAEELSSQAQELSAMVGAFALEERPQVRQGGAPALAPS